MVEDGADAEGVRTAFSLVGNPDERIVGLNALKKIFDTTPYEMGGTVFYKDVLRKCNGQNFLAELVFKDLYRDTIRNQSGDRLPLHSNLSLSLRFLFERE